MCRGLVMICLLFELPTIISAFLFKRSYLMNWLYI
nr:MAG TPA: hypothetical protein [Caudoviricetes sp.]